jgi:hypothetical protein
MVSSSCSLQDQFPDKAGVNSGAKFSITYFNSYKVVVNLQTTPAKTYVLYQRGCPVPDVVGVAVLCFSVYRH